MTATLGNVFRIGQRVQLEGCQLRGTICGFGHVMEHKDRVTLQVGDVRPIVLVQMDEGGWIDSNRSRAYVSTLVCDPSNLLPEGGAR